MAALNASSSALTEELVALGHDVTLFASWRFRDERETGCRPWPRALRLDPDVRDWVATYALMIEYVRQRAQQFDVLHFHLDYWPNSVFTRQSVPFVTTLHGRLDLPEFAAVYRTVPAGAGGVDLRQPARAAARSQLGRHGLSRHAGEPAASG